MDKKDPLDEPPEPETETDDREWWEREDHQKRRAVPVTEATAGVDVIIADMSFMDDPPAVLLKEHFPEEDGVEGETIGVHGTGEAIELAMAILGMVSQYHEQAALKDDELDDEDWPGRCIEPEVNRDD